MCNHNSSRTFARISGDSRFDGYDAGRGCRGVHPPQKRSKTMRRNRLTSIGVLTCGLVLAVGAVVGATPASAASSPTDLQSTVQAVQNATAAAVAQATGTAVPTAPSSCVDSAAAGSGLSCCSRLRPVERARRHAAAEPGLDHGDEHHGSVVSRGQCRCADQRLLALRRHRGRRQQQLFNDLSRAERAGRPGRRQRPDHGAGQCHRPAERSGDRTRARERLSLRRLRRRTGRSTRTRR